MNRNDGCVCGLVALAIARGHDDCEDWVNAMRNLRVSYDYADKFVTGWDGVTVLSPGTGGYADGLAAWQAVVEAGLAEVES